MAEHTATSANILKVSVDTNTPRGGDAGHGGVTVFSLQDEASTSMEVKVVPDRYGGSDGVEITLFGDTECSTFVECLRWAADELERQMLANRAKG